MRESTPPPPTHILYTSLKHEHQSAERSKQDKMEALRNKPHHFTETNTCVVAILFAIEGVSLLLERHSLKNDFLDGEDLP